MNCFQIPTATISLKHNILNFLWKGRCSKISWDTLCKCKEEGAMRLRKLEDLNLVARLTLIWRLINEQGLWAN